MAVNRGTHNFFKSGSVLSRSVMLFVCLLIYVPGFVVFYRSVGNPFGAVSFLAIVILVAWFWGLKTALLTSLLGVLTNFAVLIIYGDTSLVINITVQGAIFYTLVGVVVGTLSDTIRRLHKAQEEIKSLQELLPICAGCKKIRDDDGYWHQVESYISAHTNTIFSHGLCPDCLEKYYKEESEEQDSDKIDSNDKT